MPKIGDIYLFWDSLRSRSDHPYHGLVARNNNDGTVNLSVFNEVGDHMGGRTNVPVYDGTGDKPGTYFAEKEPEDFRVEKPAIEITQAQQDAQVLAQSASEIPEAAPFTADAKRLQETPNNVDIPAQEAAQVDDGLGDLTL